MSTRSLILLPRSISMCASASIAGRAAHVLLHVEHAALGLDVETAGVEADALADQRDLGMAGIAPDDVDQPRRARGGAADGVDEREVLGEEIVADDGTHEGAVAAGKRARGVLELLRAHVVGRRVDEIAGEAHALDDAAEIGAVDVAGELELHLLLVLLAIAAEAIAAEREGERRQLRIVRGIAEAVGAGREQAGQGAGPEQILARLVGALEREQDAGEGSLRSRQQEVSAGLRLEARGLGEGARARIEARRAAPPRSRAVTKVTGTAVAAWPRGRKTGCM